MKKLNQNHIIITEEMVEKYQQLNKQAKEIDKELSRLKKIFNEYFDLTNGKSEKGELIFHKYLLQRQVRVSEKYKESEAVRKLEELSLEDCIKVEKKVDVDKVQAAISLGLLEKEVMEPLKDKRYSNAIYVKEV